MRNIINRRKILALALSALLPSSLASANRNPQKSPSTTGKSKKEAERKNIEEAKTVLSKMANASSMNAFLLCITKGSINTAAAIIISHTEQIVEKHSKNERDPSINEKISKSTKEIVSFFRESEIYNKKDMIDLDKIKNTDYKKCLSWLLKIENISLKNGLSFTPDITSSLPGVKEVNFIQKNDFIIQAFHASDKKEPVYVFKKENGKWLLDLTE